MDLFTTQSKTVIKTSAQSKDLYYFLFIILLNIAIPFWIIFKRCIVKFKTMFWHISCQCDRVKVAVFQQRSTITVNVWSPPLPHRAWQIKHNHIVNLKFYAKFLPCWCVNLTDECVRGLLRSRRLRSRVSLTPVAGVKPAAAAYTFKQTSNPRRTPRIHHTFLFSLTQPYIYWILIDSNLINSKQIVLVV